MNIFRCYGCCCCCWLLLLVVVCVVVLIMPPILIGVALEYFHFLLHVVCILRFSLNSGSFYLTRVVFVFLFIVLSCSPIKACFRGPRLSVYWSLSRAPGPSSRFLEEPSSRNLPRSGPCPGPRTFLEEPSPVQPWAQNLPRAFFRLQYLLRRVGFLQTLLWWVAFGRIYLSELCLAFSFAW